MQTNSKFETLYLTVTSSFVYQKDLNSESCVSPAIAEDRVHTGRRGTAAQKQCLKTILILREKISCCQTEYNMHSVRRRFKCLSHY